MSDKRAKRLSYEDSCRILQGHGYPDAGADGNIPPLPDHRPQQNDEEPLGVSFFRTFVGEGDLENLTLPRTFFGRSEIGPISFKNTDFSESTLCWNDFNKVDFTDADLSRCDIRASVFNETKFIRTDMRNADLRHSTFNSCDFTNADMRGAKLIRVQCQQIRFSTQQEEMIDWQVEAGELPLGG
jgi:BTB/POZ domain-containing protein KCTD9